MLYFCSLKFSDTGFIANFVNCLLCLKIRHWMQNYMCLLGRVCLLFCLNSLSREYKCSFLLGFPLFSGNIGKLHFPVPLEMGENMWPVPAKDVNASDMCNFWAKRFKNQWATVYAISKSQTHWSAEQVCTCYLHTFLRSICGIWGTFYCFLYHADICRITLLPSSIPHLDCKSSLIPLHPPHLETSLISFKKTFTG